MKRKKTSGEAPVEGGGRAKRAAANVAVFFRKNIYIILMILCILAIAAMIVVAAVLGSQPDDMPDTPTIQVPDDDDDTPIVTPPDDDDTPTVDPEPEWTFAPELPVEQATVSQGHSEDELVFNATENKWKTHIGTDFAAAEGSEVKAVFDGTVTAVSTDSYYGGVVEITHENGYVTTCKLLGDVSVAVGDKVESGDVIGKIAKGFYFECADAPHVHVELKVNGEYEDISTYLKEGDK